MLFCFIPTNEVNAAVAELDTADITATLYDIPEIAKQPAKAPAAQPVSKAPAEVPAKEETLDDILNSYFAAINADPASFDILTAFEERTTASETAAAENPVVEETVIAEPVAEIAEEPAAVEALVEEAPAEEPVMEDIITVEEPDETTANVSVSVKQSDKFSLELSDIMPSEHHISTEEVDLQLAGLFIEDITTGQFSLDDIMKEYGAF